MTGSRIDRLYYSERLDEYIMPIPKWMYEMLRTGLNPERLQAGDAFADYVKRYPRPPRA